MHAECADHLSVHHRPRQRHAERTLLMRRLMRDPRPRLAALAIGSIVFLASLGVGMQLGRIASVDARAQSDRFWSLTDVRGMSAEEFSSLREMALSADLVVIGTFSDVKKGREWVANPA